MDGHDVVPDIHTVLDKMTDFANRERHVKWRGRTGKRIISKFESGTDPELTHDGSTNALIRRFRRLRRRSR